MKKPSAAAAAGGLLTDDLMDLRVKGALPRMEVLQQVADQHGVNFMAVHLRHLQDPVQQGHADLRIR